MTARVLTSARRRRRRSQSASSGVDWELVGGLCIAVLAVAAVVVLVLVTADPAPPTDAGR